MVKRSRLHWFAVMALIIALIIFVAAAILLFVTVRIQQGLVSKTPNYSAQQLYQAAQQNLDHGQFSQAESYLQEAIQHQDEVSYHGQLAVVEYQLKKYPQAVIEYQKLIDQKYELAFAYNGLGNVYRDWGQQDTPNASADQALATQNYQNALQADDHYVAAYSNLALLQFQLGNKAEALATLQSGIAKTQAPELQQIVKNIGD